VQLPFLYGSSLLCLHVSGDLWPKSTSGALALYHLWPLSGVRGRQLHLAVEVFRPWSLYNLHLLYCDFSSDVGLYVQLLQCLSSTHLKASDSSTASSCGT
jgi:hypothetical protein